MSTSPHRPVVVGVDGSPSSLQALDWAVDQAVAEGRDLVLAHGLQAVPRTYSDLGLLDPHATFAALERAGRDVVEAAAARATRRAGARGGIPVRTLLEFTDPRELLLREAGSAHLVVVGSHGRGPLSTRVMGSVGVAVATHAPCPVVVHRPTRPGRVRHGVLVATDARESSTELLEQAFEVASQRRLPLTVLHCQWDVRSASLAHDGLPPDGLDDERRALAEVMAGLREDHPDVVVTTSVVTGPPVARVVEAADRMDLLVVGAHRRSRLARSLLGSVALSVVEHVHVPVMVVPLATDRRGVPVQATSVARQGS